MLPRNGPLPSDKPGHAARLRFGLYELDLTGQLFKNGSQVRLQEQPLRLLQALVEHAGEVVSREELQAALWPPDTFVDFEAGLKTAVRKARVALGDDAENPRFIETVPRQGYRFIAPVHYVFPDPVELRPDEPCTDASPRPQLLSPVANETIAAVPRRKLQRWHWLSIGLSLLCLALTFLAIGIWPEVREGGHPTLVPLTSYAGDEYNPAISPDGSQIVFSWAGEDDRNIDLYVIDVEGGVRRRLTTDPGRDEAAAWSPDGHWIAFIRNLKDVIVVSPNGGPERKIAETVGASLSWTRDSAEILIARTEPDKSVYLDTVSLATGSFHRLTSREEQPWPYQPFALSPDGTMLAYTRLVPDRARLPFPRTGYERDTDLFIRDASGGTARRVTFFQRVMRGWAWTPDSKELVFASNHDGRFGLWRVRARGNSSPGIVAGIGEDSGFPALGVRSNDRQKRFLLAYEKRGLSVGLRRQQVRDAHGEVTGSRPIAASTRLDFCPNIAADGRVVFISDRNGYDEIWITNQEGESPIRLTHYGPAGKYPGSPRWSPDGQEIVFALQSASGSDLYVLPADGGQARQILHGSEAEASPSWSRDGKWIYFTSQHGGESQIWKIATSATNEDINHAVSVTQGGGVEAFEAPDGRTLYYLKSSADMDLWKMQIGGPDSAAMPVVDHGVENGWWGISQTGVYYADLSSIRFKKDQAGTSPKPVYFKSFKGGPPVIVGQVGRLYHWLPNLAVSPDGAYFLWGQADVKNIDLMLSRDFR